MATPPSPFVVEVGGHGVRFSPVAFALTLAVWLVAAGLAWTIARAARKQAA